MHNELLDYVRTSGESPCDLDLIRILRKGYSLWFYNMEGMREPTNWRTLAQGPFEEGWRLIAVDPEVVSNVEDMIFYVTTFCAYKDGEFRPDGELYYQDLGVKQNNYCYTTLVLAVDKFMQLQLKREPDPEIANIVHDMEAYGVTSISNDSLLHKTLVGKGYQVFEDNYGWSGLEWYAALPEFDSEAWLIIWPSGTVWLGGEEKPNE